jgi:hypothetical protein
LTQQNIRNPRKGTTIESDRPIAEGDHFSELRLAVKEDISRCPELIT